MDNLYNETKRIMKQYGIYAKKALGQNFLIDENVVETIVNKAEITYEDLVIEIGPGLGTLTNKLIEKAGKVICIELDNKMIEILKHRFENLEVINKDVLNVDLNELIFNELCKNELKHAKIVANLPYYITTPIIMKLLESNLNIESITVMIQKEVADRITAIPGEKNSGAITYSVYYYAEAEEILEVPKNSFIPEPEVTSEVIKLKLREKPPVTAKDEHLMFKIIKLAFMQRRKTLANALSNGDLFKNKEEIYPMFQELDISEKIRGEALTLEQYANISDWITKNNVKKEN